MMNLLTSVLFVLVVTTATVSAVGSGSEGSLGIGRESYSDAGVQYSYPDPLGSLQVVFPDLKFNCHGYVSNWSALTVLDSRFGELTLSIQVQLWRQTATDPDVYEFIGEETLLTDEILTGNELRDIPGDESSNLKLYEFLEETTDGTPMSFQPGDVVGFRVHFDNTDYPASVTFRNATPAEASSPTGKVTRMYVVPAGNTQQLLQVSESSSETVIHDAVVPQLLVNYVVPPSPSSSSFSSSSSSFSLPVTTSTVTTPAIPPTQDGNILIYPIVIGAVGGVCLVLLVGVVATVVCLKRRHLCSSLKELGAGTAEPCDYESAGTGEMVDHTHTTTVEYEEIPLPHNAGEEMENTGACLTVENDAYGIAESAQPIEIHGNDAYQTAADAIATEKNVAYSGRVEGIDHTHTTTVEYEEISSPEYAYDDIVLQ